MGLHFTFLKSSPECLFNLGLGFFFHFNCLLSVAVRLDTEYIFYFQLFIKPKVKATPFLCDLLRFVNIFVTRARFEYI